MSPTDASPSAAPGALTGVPALARHPPTTTPKARRRQGRRTAKDRAGEIGDGGSLLQELELRRVWEEALGPTLAVLCDRLLRQDLIVPGQSALSGMKAGCTGRNQSCNHYPSERRRATVDEKERSLTEREKQKRKRSEVSKLKDKGSFIVDLADGTYGIKAHRSQLSST